MTETELELAVTEGLYQLHTRMVEAGADPEVIAETIMEAAMTLWPELENDYEPFNKDEDNDWK